MSVIHNFCLYLQAGSETTLLESSEVFRPRSGDVPGLACRLSDHGFHRSSTTPVERSRWKSWILWKSPRRRYLVPHDVVYPGEKGGGGQPQGPVRSGRCIRRSRRRAESGTEMPSLSLLAAFRGSHRMRLDERSWGEESTDRRRGADAGLSSPRPC